MNTTTATTNDFEAWLRSNGNLHHAGELQKAGSLEAWLSRSMTNRRIYQQFEGQRPPTEPTALAVEAESFTPRVATQGTQATQPVSTREISGIPGQFESPESPECALNAQNFPVRAGLSLLAGKRVDPDHAPIPGPGTPIRFARWLLGLAMVDGEYTIRYWRGSWVQWTGTEWEEFSNTEMEHHVFRLTEDAHYEHTTGDSVEVKPWNPTPAKVASVIGTMKSVALVSDDIEPGSWVHTTRRDGIYVAFTNGVLDIRTDELIEHSPRFFNLYSIKSPCRPGAKADCPVFFNFLDSIGFSEKERPNSRLFLQEWFGYVISGLTDQQKMAMFLGKPRSGKGTLARLLGEILGGSRAVASPSLRSLTERFGLRNLIGKPLAVIGDAREVPHNAAEMLLGISGEDNFDVDIKYRDPWSGKLPTRIMILTNQMPMFKDASGVIASRFIILVFSRSFLHNEDRSLGEKLSAEIPGILQWALEGLRRLESNGRFTEPEGSDLMVLEMEESASDAKKFVREVCSTGPMYQSTPEEVFGAWLKWCEGQNRKPGTVSMLSRDLASCVDSFQIIRPRGEGGRQTKVWKGIAVR